MTQLVPEISTWRINMTSAGSMEINQAVGYLHAWNFTASGGVIALDGSLFCRLGGQNTDEEIELRYNNRIQLKNPVRGIGLRWNPQSAYTATIIIAARAEDFDADNTPATNLVVPGLGGNLFSGNFPVTTSPSIIRNLNVSRRTLTVQALSTNPAPVEIGGNTLTLGTGMILPPGAAYTVDGSLQALFGVASVAGCSVRWMEQF